MKNEIKEIIASQVDADAIIITDGARFRDLGADSLDVIEMIMEIEDKFDIDIHDDIFEITNTCTVGEFIAHIETIKARKDQRHGSVQGINP